LEITKDERVAISDRRLQFSSGRLPAGKRKRSASGSTRAGVEATPGLARLHTTGPHSILIPLRSRGCYSLLGGGGRRGGGGRAAAQAGWRLLGRPAQKSR